MGRRRRKLTVLDLFSGCGGFSLGMEQAGLQLVGAIDFDRHAVETYNANFQDHQALQRDLTAYGPEDFARETGQSQIDVIIGGPPCQGFSHVRQVDGSNHGSRLIEDPRRDLYKAYLRFVEYFQPKVFVMENVLGIRSSAGGHYFQAIQQEAKELGYSVQPEILTATDFGVPQTRRRQYFFGAKDPNVLMKIIQQLLRQPLPGPAVTLWDAIGDLPELEAGEEAREYDYPRRARHLADLRKRGVEWYLENVIRVESSYELNGHLARPHSARDLRDFAKIPDGSHGGVVERQGIKLEHPYRRDRFDDQFKRQPKNGPCSTILAHMAKDGLMFIHPEQNRSLTPREAARVQGFPDTFLFPVARTHQFRVIGNAVPPVVARAVGSAVANVCEPLKPAVKAVAKSKRSVSLV